MASQVSTRRSTLLGICLALCAFLPGRSARAAEITRVATAFDIDSPFDMDLDVGFMRTQEHAKITREHHQDAHIADVIELSYDRVTQAMPLRVAFGIFRDLELHVGTQIVFNQDSTWKYPGKDDQGRVVVDDSNSTIQNNCINQKGGLTDPNCKGDKVANAQPLFAVPGQSYRGGLDNISLGLSWAPFNDLRDDTKAKWVWSFDYGIPSADVNKPFEPTSAAKRGPIGDKVHHFTLATALSKRLGAIDPYARLSYTLPTVAPNAYSNCNVDAQNLLGYPENCGVGPWSAQATGIKPSHVGQLLFGAEFYAYDDPVKQQRVGFDVQFNATYNSEGRVYNELSDALGKLLYTEEFLTVGGSLGLNARAAKYVQLRLAAGLFHNTEHFLTNESVGQDLDGKCKGQPGSCVDLDNKTNEISPTFDFRYDMPGRRFRISETSNFTITATGVVNF